MAGNNLDRYSGAAPTEEELKRFRRLLEKDAFKERMWLAFKIWVTTLGSIATAVIAANSVFGEMLRRLFK